MLDEQPRRWKMAEIKIGSLGKGSTSWLRKWAVKAVEGSVQGRTFLPAQMTSPDTLLKNTPTASTQNTLVWYCCLFSPLMPHLDSAEWNQMFFFVCFGFRFQMKMTIFFVFIKSFRYSWLKIILNNKVKSYLQMQCYFINPIYTLYRMKHPNPNSNETVMVVRVCECTYTHKHWVRKADMIPTRDRCCTYSCTGWAGSVPNYYNE